MTLRGQHTHTHTQTHALLWCSLFACSCALFVDSYFKPVPPPFEKFVIAVPKAPKINGVQNAQEAVPIAIAEYEALRQKALKCVQRMLAKQLDVNEKKYIADAIEARYHRLEGQRLQMQQINATAKRQKIKAEGELALAQVKYEQELDAMAAAQYAQHPVNNNNNNAQAYAHVRITTAATRADLQSIARSPCLVCLFCLCLQAYMNNNNNN